MSTAPTLEDPHLEDEPVQAVLVQQPTDLVIYMARRQELRLVMTARYPLFGQGPGGIHQRVGETRGVVIPFREGRLAVPKTGQVKIVDPGGAGEAELDAALLHEWLEGHRLNGDITEGFWLVPQLPPAVSTDETDRIVDAASRWDIATLEAIILQESGGWARPDLLKIAQGAIDRIRAMEAQLAEREAEASQSAEERVAEVQRLADERVREATQRAAEAEEALAKAEKPKSAAKKD